jgi:hypothetical protein
MGKILLDMTKRFGSKLLDPVPVDARLQLHLPGEVIEKIMK